MLNPIAILVDLDGTLADVRHLRHLLRRPKKRFDIFQELSTRAPINNEVANVVRALKRKGFALVVVSGRNAQYVDATRLWLRQNDIQFDDLWMRSPRFAGSDAEMKDEALKNIKLDYLPILAIDDNPKTIEVWRRNSIPVVRVPGWSD